MPKFRIISENGVALRVIDTATGDRLRTSNVEIRETIEYGLVVTLEFVGRDLFGVDVEVGEMEAEDEGPPRQRTALS